jgi:hypothetical protein
MDDASHLLRSGAELWHMPKFLTQNGQPSLESTIPKLGISSTDIIHLQDIQDTGETCATSTQNLHLARIIGFIFVLRAVMVIQIGGHHLG